MSKSQKDFSKRDIKSKLEGYSQITRKELANVKPGDKIRYITNNEFRGGGAVKLNKFPDYIVLLNVINNVSWCMQIKADPTLQVFVKRTSEIAKDKEEMKRIYELYQQGKLKKVK